jgi:hypothetical protein
MMAKVNVHTASREELVEAGVRAELAGEILKLRRKGKVELDALSALPGVGPVTLEQLRQSLDFSDKTPSSGNGDDRTAKGADSNVKVARQAESSANETDSSVKMARQAESSAKETGSSVKMARQAESGANETDSNIKMARQAESHTEQTADATGSVARNAAEATRSSAEAGAQVTSITARKGLETIQQTVNATTEAGRETMHRAAAGTADLSQGLVDLWNEQARHNLEAMTAFSQAVDWEKVAQVQSHFVRTSFERISQMNRRYFEAVQAMMTAAASAAKNQARRTV